MNITGGKFKGQKIIAPDKNIVRPTLSKVRMAVFNTLQAMIDFEGKSFLDMFGGSGVMGLEALSRGFASVKVLEKNKNVAQIIKKNYEMLGLKADLLLIDALKYKSDIHFDVIYVDPPYYAGIYEKILEVLPSFLICILEHPQTVDIKGFNILKQKKYSDKILTFLSGEKI